MKRARQTSESIELAAILAFSGGLMDAYSYLARGKVFANAQTGNILLFGVNLADGDVDRALHYAVPVIAFAVGIALAHSIKIISKERRLHWRQAALLVEAALLIVVAFIPDDLNLVANSLTSLGCGIQVQAFRKLHGNGFATTMCIGNLRSGTQRLVDYVHEKDRTYLLRGYSLLCHRRHCGQPCHWGAGPEGNSREPRAAPGCLCRVVPRSREARP